MHEIDFLKAGDKKDAHAICMRFTRPDTGQLAHVVVDAGWQDDGDFIVEFIRERYGENSHMDLAIVTHPDGDHIGGMGKVVCGLEVGTLLIHRLDERGGSSFDEAKAVAELVSLAGENGTAVAEPFQGRQHFGGALTILGPSESYYQELLEEQRLQEAAKAAPLLSSLRESARHLADRALEALPAEEVPFGEGPGPGPRNNSSTVILIQAEEFRALLTADAGAPAIEAALDFADSVGLNAVAPDLIQIPHHGSRRNATSAVLNRVLGPIGGIEVGNAYVSVCGQEDPKHPAGRVVNAYARRGYPWNWTAGSSIRRSSPDAPPRADYAPLPEMPPLEELPDED